MTLRVRDLMTEDVATLTEDDNLASLYDLMDRKHIRHVPVVGEDDELVGIVSDRDLLRGALGEEASLPLSVRRQMLEQVKIADIMNTEPETVDPEQPAKDAGEAMMEFKVSCMPVVDGGRLVGIITEADFVRHIVETS